MGKDVQDLAAGAADERFVSALLASGPSAEIPAEHRIFAPLIGSWHLHVEWLDEDGQIIRRSEGEWHFSWVLEGRAIQDVWIVPPRARRGPEAAYSEYGTSLRFYDPSSGAWRSTWIGPMRGWIIEFVARRVDDRIVLEDRAAHGYRWTFFDIAENGFRWRNELETEAGRWRVQQCFRARRMGPVPQTGSANRAP